MQLPFFQTALKDLSLMQSKWKSILDPLISGWDQASPVMVYATGSRTGANSGNNVTVTYTNKIIDTHSAFDGVTFIAPQTCPYIITTTLTTKPTTGTSGSMNVELFVSGVYFGTFETPNSQSGFQYSLPMTYILVLNKGDKIYFSFSQNTTHALSLSNDNNNWISIISQRSLGSGG